MRREILVAAAVSSALLGCEGKPDSAPTSPELQVTGPACRYNDLKKFARNLFGSSSPGYDLAQAMSGQAPNSAAATNLGFDIFAAIAALRNGSASGFTSTQVANAANLTIHVVRCGDVNVTGANTLTAYSEALGTTGAYEVRGGTSTAGVSDPSGSVLSFDKQAGIQAPANNFGAWLGGRALFYGRPVTPFAGELTGVAAGLSGRVTFDWSLVASTSITMPFATKGKTSLCVTVEDDASAGRLRVQKTTHILEISTPVTGIACTLTVASAEPLSLGQRLVAMGTRWFTPPPLHAAALRRTTSPTGGLGSLSPFQVGNPLAVGLTFVSQPVDGRVGQPIAGSPGPNIRVYAEGNAGSPWEGVLIELLASNNNGVTVRTDSAVAVTNAQGIATFPGFSINKSGGYKAIAVTVPSDADIAGFVPDSVISDHFNLRP